ncbi:hypothetical protein FS763_01450 [Agrobacterium vitis]|uniref:hypothetical protein n=1 Tax=Allorhizobium ampelinum TaxID=3025782 RepID=UPI001F1CFC41|nr:hypothetical protein [Allorhizobium ampelinum]MCF1470595.1 hypothetical protein [Allorhizobium ampelinum]
MEPVTANVILRPLRLGYLVDPREKQTVRDVMRMATTMWGGMMSPLIPVMKRLPAEWNDKNLSYGSPQISRGYIRFFEPDLLVQTKAGQLASLGLSEEPNWTANQRFFNFDNLIRKDHGLAADLNVGTNISNIYQRLFKDEFQFKKRVDPAIFHFTEGASDDTSFFEAAFGYFPKSRQLSYFKSNYKHAFDAKQKPPTFETWLDLMKGAGFPLYYTVRDTELHFGRSDPSIFIFDPSKPTDLIDFWNYRLFTRDVLPVNVNWLAESRELILRAIRRNHRLLPTNPNGVMIHTSIEVARSLKIEDVSRQLDLASAKLPERSVSMRGWYEPIWREPQNDEPVFRPSAVTITQKSRQVQLTPSGDKRIMLQFPVQSPNFDFVQRGEGPSFVNVVKLRQYQAEKSIADALPAATFSTRDSYPTRGLDQFVSREGYVTFHSYSHDDAYLNLPSPKDAITSWLEAKGITAIPSDAGRVAEQVIASVGGLSGTNILRERGILEQLNSMARSRREWQDGSADEFTDRTASVQDWIRTLKPIQKKVFGNWKTLDRLVADGMLRLGLAPRCPHCTQENWYSLNDVADQLSCARCLKTYPFPQGNPDGKLFKYRVVGPFATPGYARGGYAVALTLRFLQHGLGSMNALTFSTGLELQHAGGRSETDFFAWHGKDNLDRASRDPATVVGECKSFAAESFKAADVARLRELATLLPGSIIVAATLKDEFSGTENKALRSLAKWGWTQLQPSPLILLTGQELFSEGPLTNAWKESGGTRAMTAERERHIFDLVTLADATQQAVLGMSSEDVASSRYKRSRALSLKRLKLQKEI